MSLGFQGSEGIDVERLSDLPRLFVCLWRPEQSHEAWICRVSSDEQGYQRMKHGKKSAEASTNSGCAYIALMR